MNLSISRIKAFKACRRMYELKYIEELEPVKPAEALETGKTYHSYIDSYYKGETIVEDNFTKERAMFEAYLRYIAPHFQVERSEQWLEYDLGNGNKLVGIADGIAADGRLVEHKTTSGDITEQYEYNLQWDEQILAYMLMTGSREVWYTVCKKPTIRQKQNETEEQFYHRMIQWYEEDTDSKIRLLLIKRTDEDIENFLAELKEMCVEMKSCDHFYRNSCHCNIWGRRCEYSSICLNYNPDENYIEFEKRSNIY